MRDGAAARQGLLPDFLRDSSYEYPRVPGQSFNSVVSIGTGQNLAIESNTPQTLLQRPVSRYHRSYKTHIKKVIVRATR